MQEYRYAFSEYKEPRGVPLEVRQRHMKEYDPEADAALDEFDCLPPGKLLEIGASDFPGPNIFTDLGFTVTSVDLREYDHPSPPGHRHVVGDFNDLPAEFYAEHFGTFDVAVSISALEHFGMGAYGDPFSRLADASACALVHHLLRPGGIFLVEVPFGGRMTEVASHWRVYDMESFLARIAQNFTLVGMNLEIVEEYEWDGVTKRVGSKVDMFHTLLNQCGAPNTAVIAKLMKTSGLEKK